MPPLSLQHPASAAHAMNLAAERRREAKSLQRKAAALATGSGAARRLLQRAERALEAAEFYGQAARGEFAATDLAPPVRTGATALVALL